MCSEAVQSKCFHASPVVQWLRVRLAMQGIPVQSWVQEDSTYRGATKPMHHSYGAHLPYSLSSAAREATAERNLCITTGEWTPARCNWRKSMCKNEDPVLPKKKKKKKNNKLTKNFLK